MADEFDLRRIIWVLAGADDHLVDQRTCCLQHLRRVAALDGLSQRGNPPGVEFGKVRVQGRCGSRLLLEGGEQLLLPCFQLLELALHPWRAHPFGDGLDDLLLRPGTDNARSGDRVAQPRVAVPAQQTGIGRIAEDAIAPPCPASDAGVIPGGAGRAGNALGVQSSGNRSRAVPLDKLGKNPPHDRRFGRPDLTQAALRLAVSAEAAQRVIAIGRPAAGATLADASLLAAMGLLGEVPQVHGTHGAPDADMQLGDLALAEGYDLHLLERGLLVEGRDMLEVARETVEALREDEIDLAAADGRQQGMVAGPDERRAGDGRIGVGAGDGPALTLRAREAQPQLVLDRRRVLQIAAEPGAWIPLRRRTLRIRERVFWKVRAPTPNSAGAMPLNRADRKAGSQGTVAGCICSIFGTRRNAEMQSRRAASGQSTQVAISRMTSWKVGSAVIFGSGSGNSGPLPIFMRGFSVRVCGSGHRGTFVRA